MDKTLFELVPISVKPEKEGWYDLIDPEGDLKAGSYYFKSDWWWEDENYTADEDFTVDDMFYLRPLPPPVAEERTFTLAEAMEIYISAYANGTWDEIHHYYREKIEMKEYFQEQFNITLPE